MIHEWVLSNFTSFISIIGLLKQFMYFLSGSLSSCQIVVRWVDDRFLLRAATNWLENSSVSFANNLTLLGLSPVPIVGGLDQIVGKGLALKSVGEYHGTSGCDASGLQSHRTLEAWANGSHEGRVFPESPSRTENLLV